MPCKEVEIMKTLYNRHCPIQYAEIYATYPSRDHVLVQEAETRSEATFLQDLSDEYLTMERGFMLSEKILKKDYPSILTFRTSQPQFNHALSLTV